MGTVVDSLGRAHESVMVFGQAGTPADPGAPVLAAGNNHIGQTGKTASLVTGTLNGVTLAVIAAAGDYADNDVVSHSATAGVPWLFDAVARSNGRTGTITKALLVCSTPAVAASFRLWLFNVTPTGAQLNDNVASALNVAQLVSIVGWIDFPALANVGGFAVSQNTTPLSFKCDTADDALYGILQITDAETNESPGMLIQIRLMVEQN